jgi:hypothetical protein
MFENYKTHLSQEGLIKYTTSRVGSGYLHLLRSSTTAKT